MAVGLLIILAGVLIIIYPVLLAFIVAFALLVVGSVICLVSYRFKKLERHFDNPFMEFFIKY